MRTKRPAQEPILRQRLALGALAALVLIVAGSVLFGRRLPPQMGSSPEVFGSVDALFTAVTARNDQWLADCEQRLRAHHDAGALNDPAWKRLKGVIAKARGGNWESAAHTLYDFIQGQRREGPQASAPRATSPSAKAANSGRFAAAPRPSRP